MITFTEIHKIVSNNDHTWPGRKNKKIGGWSYKQYTNNRMAYWLMRDDDAFTPGRDVFEIPVCDELKESWELWLLKFKLQHQNWKEEYDIYKY